MASTTISAQTAFINEIDYDQPGTDAGEFVEVAIDLSSCGGVCDPTHFSLSLYRDVGTVYNTFTVGTTSGVDGDYNLFAVLTPGIQNGTADGLALVYDDGVNPAVLIEFISYEGTLTATEGPANGMTSTDVGIADSNDAPNESI